MTDNEIIKALEYCKDCSININEEILDLINRQKAEIEKYRAELKETTEKFNCQQIVYADLSDIIREKNAEIERLKTACPKTISTIKKIRDTAKAEAIKEFWSRLQGIAYRSEVEWSHGEHPMLIELDDAEEIYEEMVGEG